MVTYDFEFNEPVCFPKMDGIYKRLYDLVEVAGATSSGEPILRWSDFIDNNWKVFEEICEPHEDEDMFVYNCIKQINEWLKNPENLDFVERCHV